MKRIDECPMKISLVFKDLKADFFKRAEGDTYFTCTQGQEIGDLVDTVSQSGEREELPINVTATVPDKFGDEPVANFEMTLSLKKKEQN